MSSLRFAALSLALSPLLPALGAAPQGARDDARVPPDVSSYAGIDAALEGRVLLAPDAVWRYLPGTENPSPKLEWTKEDFDDSSWAAGPAPFGSGAEYTDLGTRLEAGCTALYLRRVFDIPDLAGFGRVLFQVPIDDGYVLSVNGKEEDRLHADKADTYHAFDGTTTSERTVEVPPVPATKLLRALRAGSNTLALQVLTHTSDRDSLAAYPRIVGVYRVSEVGETARLAQLSALLANGRADGEDDQARLQYLEGRHRQRLERPAEAIEWFARSAELDPAARAPWQRLVEVHRSTGTLARLDAELFARFSGGARAPAMLDAWADVALGDLGQSPVDFAARVGSVEHDPESLPSDGAFAEALWSGHTLAAGRSLRIDCGAGAPGDVSNGSGGDGEAWDRDRCFGEGTSARALGGASPLGSIRICSRSLDVLVPVYRVPLASGAYEVVLHFAPSDGEGRSAGDAVFDVALEDARVARAVDPAADGAPSSLRFALFVRDAFLDLDLLPQTKVDPWLAGLEIHPLSAEDPRFTAAVDEWVRATGRRATLPLAQLAEIALAADDLVAASAVLEEAERLPDFDPASRARLAEVRDRLLPEVLSFAAVDDLLERRPDEAQALLAAAREAGASQAVVPYFEGRVNQLAGHPDEAIIGFEELAFGDGTDPLPVQRMVECLASGNLAEEALAILADALDRGVEPSTELLQLWISLQLGALGVDPWDVIDGLAALDVPDELVVVPTSEHAARTWRITNLEPPAIAWSRPDFDDSDWRVGTGMIGSGNTILGTPRSHSNEDMAFGRQPFTLLNGALLFPYFDVYANDAGECYLNGTLVSRISIATDGYVHMPIRQSPLVAGKNNLGQFGYNTRDASMVDTGIMQPLGELMWIKRQLDEQGAIRINCGGDDLVTADGREWSRDRFFGWALATPEASPELEIAGTEHDALYRTNRWFYDDAAGAYYQLPLPNGRYRVTLHFAEIDEKHAPDAEEESVRTFDVRLEKELVIDDLDVVAEAGFAAALVRELDIEITDGWFDLLINDLENRSFLSALEIEVVDGN